MCGMAIWEELGPAEAQATTVAESAATATLTTSVRSA